MLWLKLVKVCSSHKDCKISLEFCWRGVGVVVFFLLPHCIFKTQESRNIFFSHLLVQSNFNGCITSLPFYWHFPVIFNSSLFLFFLSLLSCMPFRFFFLLVQLPHLYGTPLSLARLIQIWSGDAHT